MKIMKENNIIPHNYPVADVSSIPDEEGYFIDPRARFYGHVKCCSCGKVLGTEYVRYNPKTDLALVVGYEDDDEGREWRSFCPDCAKKVAAAGDSPSEIMKKYPVSELVEC